MLFYYYYYFTFFIFFIFYFHVMCFFFFYFICYFLWLDLRPIHFEPNSGLFAGQQPTYSNRPTDSKAQCEWPALFCFPDCMYSGLSCSIHSSRTWPLSRMAGYTADHTKGSAIAAPTFVISSYSHLPR